MSFQKPLKHPKVKAPIDLPAALLSELASLFVVEAREHERLADIRARENDIPRAAAHDVAAIGLRFDSREIIYWADVNQRRRAHEAEDNLLPWERGIF